MSDVTRLYQAFLHCLGEPDTRSHKDIPLHQTDPERVIWFGRNIWLYPGQKRTGDAQLTAWRGNARVGDGKEEGVWFGLTLEFKDVFRCLAASKEFTPVRLTEAVRALPGSYYVSLGEAMRNGKGRNYRVLHAGIKAQRVDGGIILNEVDRIMRLRNPNHLPRPHLQVYRKIGAWCGGLSSSLLVSQMAVCEREMLSLIALVNHRYHPCSAV